MCDKKGKNFYPREEKQPGQGGGSARSLDGKGNVQLRLGPAALNSGKHLPQAFITSGKANRKP